MQGSKLTLTDLQNASYVEDNLRVKKISTSNIWKLESCRSAKCLKRICTSLLVEKVFLVKLCNGLKS